MKYIVALVLVLFSLTSCIENDIPYPKMDLQVISVEVEGQSNADDSNRQEAVISKKERKISLYVNDRVDLSQLKITRFEITEGAKVTTEGCPSFPEKGFLSLKELDNETDAVVDCTEPVVFKLSKYQDYNWTMNVTQVVKREIDVDGMAGNPVIDLKEHKVVIYVDKELPLDEIKVNQMDLGGQSGTVTPDPRTLTDFTFPVEFQVKTGWETTETTWTVYVFNKIYEEPAKISAFPMTTSAIISGGIQNGKIPSVQFRKEGDTDWIVTKEIVAKEKDFTATLGKLLPSTTYEYQVVVADKTPETLKFVTAPATPLENGGFEEWHLEKNKIWNPWNTNKDSFWDTGNDGAAIVSKSNSIPSSEDTYTGKGKAASLETKNMLGFLAAGNIFTGTYVRTEVPNGVLSFGRKFNAFPTKLRIHYKYKSATISHVKEPFENLRGEADMCHIYIALTQWEQPLEIRTNPSKRQLFDKNDPQVIAYAELVQSTSSETWETKDLVLEYRQQAVPTHLLIVATSSKYGDYFTGGEGSRLLVDDFELIYE